MVLQFFLNTYTQRNMINYFTMNVVENVLIADQKNNTVSVVDSPNFANAGKGLISFSKKVITPDTGMPYWGCVYVQSDCNTEDIDMPKCFKDRMVKLKFQPFKKIGITLYMVGSLSCAATYANDAEFSGWETKKRKRDSTISNNCFLWESAPLDTKTVQGFVKWLKSCPVWLYTSAQIKYQEEMLCKYF